MEAIFVREGEFWEDEREREEERLLEEYKEIVKRRLTRRPNI